MKSIKELSNAVVFIKLIRLLIEKDMATSSEMILKESAELKVRYEFIQIIFKGIYIFTEFRKMKNFIKFIFRFKSNIQLKKVLTLSRQLGLTNLSLQRSL